MRLRGVWAIIVVGCSLALGSLTADVPAAAASSAPTPVVQGNHLVDSRTGSTWVAHAVNWPSFEYACQQGWAYAQSGRTAAAAAAMVSWRINAVRLPLNEACWLGVDGSPAYGSAAGYRAAVADWVSILNAAGLVVILDLHWSAPSGLPADGQRAMPDSRSLTFWQQVAGAYAGNGSVLFDAFNEPYSRWNPATSSWAFQLSWTCWRDGGCSAPVENDESGTVSGTTYAVVGMSAIVSAIRTAGAAQPILLGGLDYSNDMRGWLAHRPADGQLVASWHNYPGQRCQSTTCWNAEIVPLAAAVPVIATEFGQTDGGNGFLTSFMTWADAHGIGYSPWAWWRTDASDGTEANLYALIDGDDFRPRAPAGTAYHDHLAGTSAPPAPATPSPAGFLDSATGVTGGIRITGWSLDRSTTASTYVWVNVDGRGGPIVADRPLAWIATSFPGLGTSHGFDAVIPASSGNHTVCAYGTASLALGCRSVSVPRDTQFSLDSVSAVPGGVRVTGWALDRRTTEPVYIWINVDGVGGPARADVSLPWIDTYAGVGDRHGFDTTLAVAPGTHAICVYGPAPDLVGCRTVTVGRTESFDSAVGVIGGVRVSGWAADSRTSSPVYVWVNVDGRGGPAVADRPLPWIGALLPGIGTSHGFDTTVAASPGSHQVCVYGYGSASMGCRAVSVPTPGSFDSIAATAGGIRLTGWAVTPQLSSPAYVWINVDGTGGPWIANKPLDWIDSYLPGAGSDHGFDVTLSAGPGSHVVCVYGHDAAPLGCKSVVVG